jgi:hypothetical protein
VITKKFDELDRKKVITQVEAHFSVKLARVGTRKKYLQDQNNRTFWVFGGVEDWHGIPLDMMQAEERQKTDGILIIAKRNRSNIDIYWGSLQTLIENKRLLSHTQKGDFQFNLRERGAKLIIHEIPELSLCKLGDAAYSESEKTTDKSIEKVGVLLRKLSPEAREHLFEELAKKSV